MSMVAMKSDFPRRTSPEAATRHPTFGTRPCKIKFSSSVRLRNILPRSAALRAILAPCLR